MRGDKPLVGFDRYIRKAWMDYAAQLVVNGSVSEANELIEEYLESLISGNSSRRHTKSILAATWINTKTEESEFKKEAILLYPTLNAVERLAIHYGMCIATYPFFLSAGKILGRLFKLQDEVTSAEFYRRVIESTGDRDSVKRAAGRYLQSLTDWRLIEHSGTAAVKPVSKVQLTNPELITWLFASVLLSSERDRLSINDIVSDPVWFPFEIPHGLFNYSNSNLIDVVHQGVGETLVSIKK